jgi:membrane protease YdiL (CAAX protease family)
MGFVVTVVLVATAGVPGSGAGTHQAPTSPAMGSQVQAALVWCLAAWVGAMLSAIPVVRERVARWLPIDPDSPVHAAALALISSLVILSLGQLAATGGRPVLLTIIQNHPDQLKDSAVDTVVEMALTMAFVIPGSWMVVGWPLFRSLREALERLGVVAPTAKQVIGALVTAVAMVIVFQGLDWVTNAIWSWTHWPKTDGEAFDRLIKPLITPGGALLIGLSAGVTEELMVRGALQPRLGIIASNLFFTSLHAFQYGFDGLISVFMAGLVLGLVRKRTNTTCSAITHGTYDFILVLMSWFVAH